MGELAEALAELAHLVSTLVGLLGCAIIVYGVARGLFGLVRAELRGTPGDRPQLRRDLGFYFLLALEFLIAADIIETIVSPGLEELAFLAGVVVVRALIGLPLSWELRHES